MVMSSFVFFGKTELTDEIISNAEKFFLKFISDQNLDKFDDIRNELYHKKLHQFTLEKFPSTSSSIRQLILQAYLQCHLRLHALFIEVISRNLLQYGYMLNEEDHLVPSFSIKLSTPCNCLKCA